MLNREGFSKAAAPKTKIVEIPEWEGSVCIRQLSAKDIVDHRKPASSNGDEAGDIGIIVDNIIHSVVEESTGAYVFNEGDRTEIMGYSVAGLFRLARAINEFNGLPGGTAKN